MNSHLNEVREFACQSDPRNYVAWGFMRPVGFPKVNRSWVRGQTKNCHNPCGRHQNRDHDIARYGAGRASLWSQAQPEGATWVQPPPPPTEEAIGVQCIVVLVVVEVEGLDDLGLESCL